MVAKEGIVGSEETIQLVIPILIALIAATPGILAYFRGRKKEDIEVLAIESGAEKTDADASNVVVLTALSLVEPMKKRLESLEKRDELREKELCIMKARMARLEHANYLLCTGVRRLIHQIQSLGATPVFEIDESLCKEFENGVDDA
jgi:hypothetical protein